MSATKVVTYEEELKKNPELREQDIQMLKEWCDKQPHLPKISNAQLALFLHSNYYRLEPTKSTIENYYTLRTHVPEFFHNRDPIGNKDLRKAFKIGAIMTLEAQTADGYEILYGRLMNTDASNYVYNEHMKVLNMVNDLWLRERGTIKGHIFVLDCYGVTLGHAGRLNPLGLKKYLTYLQEGLPVRLKGLHFINSFSVMDIILNMMKPFMKKELMDILHIHTSNDSLAKFLSPDILPNESGGKAGPVADILARTIDNLDANRDYFLEEEQNQRVDESKRIGKSKSATDLFGVEGSFKKLDID